MAKPDCDDGWFKLSHELDAALAVADFTKGARIVLREVFAQIYGPAKRKTAHLSPTSIAGRVGCLKQHIARAIRELVSAKALEQLEDGAYRFLKDYEAWLGPSGSPRLSEEEAVYCRHAPFVAIAYRHFKGAIPRNALASLGNSSGNASMDVGNSLGNGSLPESFTKGNDSDYGSLPESFTEASPPKNPLLGSGEERLEKKDRMTSSSSADEVEGGLRRPVQNDPAEIKRVADWAHALGPRGLGESEALADKVNQFKDSYPIGWIEDAIQCGLVASPGHVWRYAITCLLSWWQKGEPDHAEVAKAKNVRRAVPDKPPHRAARNPNRPTLRPKAAQRTRERKS